MQIEKNHLEKRLKMDAYLANITKSMLKILWRRLQQLGDKNEKQNESISPSRLGNKS